MLTVPITLAVFLLATQQPVALPADGATDVGRAAIQSRRPRIAPRSRC